MRTIVVSDPSDRMSPFEELANATLLMYHGTHSIFCPLIESTAMNAIAGKKQRFAICS